jgi:L,D-transpeptidase catalytic domain
MKFVLKSMSMAVMLLLFLTLPAFISGTTHSTGNPVATDSKDNSSKKMVFSQSMEIYESMKLKRLGLSRAAFDYAWKGYQQLSENGKIAKENILAICDFSQSSRRKRFYIIDVIQKKILINTYVAHGRNSGSEYARSFSNSAESHMSSLGFYVTKDTYWGGHGLALRIEGVDNGFNDNAYDRNIVIHGSDYVGDKFIKSNPFNGRSFGCPAVPARQTTQIINTIKDGSCLFIYHPTKKYLTNSKILNG